jgi:hypothetical protein
MLLLPIVVALMEHDRRRTDFLTIIAAKGLFVRGGVKPLYQVAEPWPVNGN